jgi:hypothetical protein
LAIHDSPAAAVVISLGAGEPGIGRQWYIPAQQPAILFGSQSSGKLTVPSGGYVAIRSALPPEHMIQTLRSTVAEVDALLALQQV